MSQHTHTRRNTQCQQNSFFVLLRLFQTGTVVLDTSCTLWFCRFSLVGMHDPFSKLANSLAASRAQFGL